MLLNRPSTHGRTKSLVRDAVQIGSKPFRGKTSRRMVSFIASQGEVMNPHLVLELPAQELPIDRIGNQEASHRDLLHEPKYRIVFSISYPRSPTS
jgi:hypothetical protein